MNSTERFFDIWKDNVLGNKDDLAIGLSQLDKEIRSDERSKTITELESRLLNIKYNDESVFEFVSVDSILKMLEQMKGEQK